jgi:hypothetical protein
MKHQIGCQQFYQNSSPELNVFTICMLYQIGCLQFYQESSPELYVCIICMLHQSGCLQFYQNSSPPSYVFIICMLHHIGCLQFYRNLSISNIRKSTSYILEPSTQESSSKGKQLHQLTVNNNTHSTSNSLAQANSTPQVCLRSLIGLIVAHY